MNYIVPCPFCNTINNTQYVDTGRGIYVMCWDECGTDFQVNPIWFMLNRIEVDEI